MDTGGVSASEAAYGVYKAVSSGAWLAPEGRA